MFTSISFEDSMSTRGIFLGNSKRNLVIPFPPKKGIVLGCEIFNIYRSNMQHVSSDVAHNCDPFERKCKPTTTPMSVLAGKRAGKHMLPNIRTLFFLFRVKDLISFEGQKGLTFPAAKDLLVLQTSKTCSIEILTKTKPSFWSLIEKGSFSLSSSFLLELDLPYWHSNIFKGVGISKEGSKKTFPSQLGYIYLALGSKRLFLM
jgi:hypothetical protein